jgi:KUP system potassium uptake protein
VVLGFKSSSNLAAAYGIAVTGTMLIDTILVAFVMVLLWRWHPLVVALVAGAFLLVDIAFFAANVIKIPEGGWFPIVMGLISFTVLTTWRRGRKLVRRELAKQGIPMSAFLPAIGSDIHRVSGTAVFMTSSKEGVPAAAAQPQAQPDPARAGGAGDRRDHRHALRQRLRPALPPWKRASCAS